LGVVSIFLFLAPTLSFAFFCPNNFNQIQIGDTLDQVTQQCGKPDSQEKKPVEPNVPQEWIYFIPQTVAMGGGLGAAQGTLRTSFSFDQDGKVLNITVNGIGVGGTMICNNTNIQLGASQDDIKAACGKPSFINKQQTAAATSETKQSTQITFTYNTSPPAQLIFVDGVLKERK
jgi:hypothetical protein